MATSLDLATRETRRLAWSGAEPSGQAAVPHPAVDRLAVGEGGKRRVRHRVHRVRQLGGAR